MGVFIKRHLSIKSVEKSAVLNSRIRTKTILVLYALVPEGLKTKKNLGQTLQI
jgi:hypothetical protein